MGATPAICACTPTFRMASVHRRPLVVALHGCTQTADSYDQGTGWSDLADRLGFILIFPEQQPANNPKNCFSWFLPADTARDSGEALSIRQMIAKAVEKFGVDRSRMFVTGLSAGGAMASVMLATYPEIFAGGAIIAGLPYGSASSVQEAFEAMFNDRAPSSRALGDHVRGASNHRGPVAEDIGMAWHGRHRCPAVKRGSHHQAMARCAEAAGTLLRRGTDRAAYPPHLEGRKRRHAA